MIYINLGRRELGKSTLALFMVLRLRKRVILDPRRMIRRQGDRIEYVTSAADFNEALQAMMFDDESDEVIYQPQEDDLDQAFESFTRALKSVVIQAPDQELGIFIDEASFYDLETPTFMWLVKCSLREYTHVIVTAHQPKDIPTGVRAIADHWFIFYTTQETDLAKIAEKSPDAAREAKKLKGRAFVHWDDTKAVLKINSNPDSWFVAMRSATPNAVAIVTPDSQPVHTLPLLKE